MTDAEIDGLSDVDLDIAVHRQLGHEIGKGDDPMVRIEHLGWVFRFRHDEDIGAAFGLLMEFDRVDITIFKTNVMVEAQMPGAWKPIATGPKTEAASILCKAWLKLKAREA